VRDFSVALKAGIASEVTTLGWLMSITRRDGTIGRYNTIGVDYTFGGSRSKPTPVSRWAQRGSRTASRRVPWR
jgi:hypothetical protein